MRIKTKITIGILLAYVSSVIFAIYTDGLFLIAGSTAAMFAALCAVHVSDDGERDDVKNVMAAEFLSNIPGFGHLYLGRRRRSIPFLLLFAVFALSIYFAVLHPSDAEYIIVIMFVMTMMYGMIMSKTDVRRLCDEMEHAYDNPEDEVYAPQFHPEYYLITLGASLIAIALTIFFWFFDWNEDRIIWFYAVTGIAWSIGLCISTVFIGKWIMGRKKDVS